MSDGEGTDLAGLFGSWTWLGGANGDGSSMNTLHGSSGTGRRGQLVLLAFVVIACVANANLDNMRTPDVPACRAGLESRSPSRHAAAAHVFDNAREGRGANAMSYAIASNRFDLVFDDEFRIDCILLTLAHIGAKSLNEDNDQEFARVLGSALPLVTSPVLNELLRWYVFESSGDMSRRIGIARQWMYSVHQTMPMSCGDCDQSYSFDPRSDGHDDAVLAMYAVLIDGYHRGSASDDIAPILDGIYRQYTSSDNFNQTHADKLSEHRDSMLRWMRNSGM
ncbi:MAG: hypothetical protein JJU33_12625 [Phycisphaerales bacterium]|nr:hypothetical protein [Phycisphaerales bacterium]